MKTRSRSTETLAAKWMPWVYAGFSFILIDMYLNTRDVFFGWPAEIERFINMVIPVYKIFASIVGSIAIAILMIVHLITYTRKERARDYYKKLFNVRQKTFLLYATLFIVVFELVVQIMAAI